MREHSRNRMAWNQIQLQPFQILASPDNAPTKRNDGPLLPPFGAISDISRFRRLNPADPPDSGKYRERLNGNRTPRWKLKNDSAVCETTRAWCAERNLSPRGGKL